VERCHTYRTLTISSQMLDYDAARSKVRKLQDKPSDDSIKLPRVSRSPRSLIGVYPYPCPSRPSKNTTKPRRFLIS
jgi:hypothetical protein